MQSQPPEVPRNLLALKSMVIGMAGLLILCALILVGVGVSRMSGEKVFDPATIPLAAGCQLGEVSSTGESLIIPITGRDDCRKVIIVDLESGAVRGEIAFPPD